MLGNPKILLLAFLGLDTEYYNGAWWFLTIYILLKIWGYAEHTPLNYNLKP